MIDVALTEQSKRKKKIAICFNHLVLGGAEKALFNFMHEIDDDQYEITLFTANLDSYYLDVVDSKVKMRSSLADHSKNILIEDLKHFRFLRCIKDISLRVLVRVFRGSYFELGLCALLHPMVREKYDCAIAYKMNYEDMAFPIYRINAKKKCVVCHSSTAAEQSKAGRFAPLLFFLLKKYDKIFCVSEQNQKELIETYPRIARKTEVMHNILYSEDIIQKSSAPITGFDSKCSICTVGRLSKEKGQTLIPKTVRLLLDAGYTFKWYLVGDGAGQTEIEQNIQKYGVEDFVIFLGPQKNPYPYIKNCAIYVQPSFSEGYCTTTMEAKILRKPIVTTDAPGMREQFVSGENGLIVDAMTPEALFEGIKTLLDHPEMQQKFIKNLSYEAIDNPKELQKLYDFIES